MKKMIIALLCGVCFSAHGQIYKYVDPVTGAVEYLNYDKGGGLRMDSVDTLSEIPIASPVSCNAACEKSRATRIQRTDATANTINKRWPGACRKLDAGHWSCVPRVGMNVREHAEITGLRRVGFTEDASGKVDRWAAGGCRVLVAGDKISSVSC